MRDVQGRYGNGLYPLEEKKEDLNIPGKWTSNMQLMQRTYRTELFRSVPVEARIGEAGPAVMKSLKNV